MSASLLPILIAVGAVTGRMAALIPGLVVVALLSTGTAALHTPKDTA